jgi:Fe-coproporphyrin III synthase
MCTNGHFGFRRNVEAVSPYLAKLRISLEGLAHTNDQIRQRGGFGSALRTMQLARDLGVTIGVTTTVTALNLTEIVPLARLLHERGVAELKLHCLRLVGNAAAHPELAVADAVAYADMHARIGAAGLPIKVLYDADLSPHPHSAACQSLAERSGHLDRIEVDPRGALTMSCKAVGQHANAFRWDSIRSTVVYEPHSNDELTTGIPDVLYKSS